MAGKNRAQEVRIIGGKWKGRKLPFQGSSSLRPTPGRSRETLFNWLRPYIGELRCLDLFAGSGVLGFEALSQGAERCVFVDKNRKTIDRIRSNIALLQTDQAEVRNMDALRFLRSEQDRYDVVFLDPPFNAPELLAKAMELLIEQGIATNYIYAESRDDLLLTDLASRFSLKLAGRTKSGDSQGSLWQVELQP